MHYGVADRAGRHVVIIGRGLTIGRPLANLLALKRPNANAAVTVVHTGVPDLGAYTRTADILVAAAGAPGLLTADMVKPGAAVVAAGVTFVDGKVVSRRGRRRGRGGGLAVAAHRRGRPHDPGAADGEHRRAPAGTTRRASAVDRGLKRHVMARIHRLFADGPTLSFEFFPPKTAAGRRVAPRDDRRAGELRAVVRLGHLRRGRSTRARTRDLVTAMNERLSFPAMPHLTCVGQRRGELRELLEHYRAAGIDNVLALAGDPPADGSPAVGDFTYATELIELDPRRSASSRSGWRPFPSCTPARSTAPTDRRRLAAQALARRLRHHPVLLRGGAVPADGRRAVGAGQRQADAARGHAVRQRRRGPPHGRR